MFDTRGAYAQDAVSLCRPSACVWLLRRPLREKAKLGLRRNEIQSPEIMVGLAPRTSWSRVVSGKLGEAPGSLSEVRTGQQYHVGEDILLIC